MSSNTALGNTPVNQGYVQLIHTGETGGIDGTLRTLYDGDGTASDLQIASNSVKVSTQLYIGAKTITEYIQDTVGAMLVTNASHTNLSAAYDDAGDGAIDLTASGEVTLTGTQTLTNKTLASPTFTGTANGANLTLTGDLTVSGDTIFTNSNTVLIGDAILTLNADETGSPTANAGFEVERGTSTNKTFIWNETDDKWTIGSETFVASTVEANLTGNVTGNVTGSASLNLLKSSNLSDLANVATARSNLGVDPAGTDNSTNVTLVTTSHDYLSLAGQAITLGTIDISDDTNLVGGTGITLTGDTLSTTDSEIVHDNLSGFVENEHKDHSGISITTAASSGLSGGGDITTTRSLSVDVNNLDVQVPALELADKIAIYDNSVGETNVATLTQLKAIVNTDTDTNQLTTFNVSGDSGTDQTISHNNTLTISGGNGISTSTSATDILSVALGGFSTLIAQSSPAEQDLLVIEEAIGGAIKKVQVGALSSGISFNGSTANGLLTYGGTNNIDTEANLTFDGGKLHLSSGTAQTDNDGMLKVEQTSTSSGSAATNAGINTKNYHGTSQFMQWEEHGLRIGSRILTNSGTGDVVFTAGADSEKMRILAGGNVGIGTSSPGYKLDVSGTGRFTGLITASGGIFTDGSSLGYTSDGYSRASSGNASVPGFSFASDTNTGMYKVGADKLGFTSGGTLAMMVDSNQNVGIGTSSPQANLEIDSNTNGNTSILILENTGLANSGNLRVGIPAGNGSYASGATLNDIVLRNETAGGSIIIGAQDSVQIGVAGSDNDTRMIVNSSGNVGIGTASPASKLHIDDSTNYNMEIRRTSNNGIKLEAGSGSPLTSKIKVAYNDFSYIDAITIVNQTAGAYTQGNVGIGTTSPQSILHIGTGNTSRHIKVSDNRAMFGYDGANAVVQGGSTKGIKFNTNSDTFAGSPKMTITTAGNVGISTTSPNHLLEIEGQTNDTEVVQISNDAGGSGSVTGITHLGITHFPGNTYSSTRITAIENGTASYTGHLAFSTRSTNSDSAPAERMRITSAGNVGIGEVSPAYKLDVAGQGKVTNGWLVNNGTTAGFFTTDSDNVNFGASTSGKGLRLFTANAEKMRIDSSGRLLIGGTSASGHGFNLEVLNDHAYVKGPDGWNGTGDKAIVALGSGVSNESFGCGYVYGTGLVLSTYKLSGGGDFGSSTQNSLVIADTTGQASFINDVVAYASSDKRLKENVKPLDNALDKIKKINGVEFDWIDGKDEHGNSVHGNEGHDVGVIAQEIEKVLPEVVHTRDNGYKAVKYEKIVPLLIQAIKEQQQQIEELKNG